MILCISNAIDDAHGGIQEIESIQVITPSKRGDQDEKEYGSVLNGRFREFRFFQWC